MLFKRAIAILAGIAGVVAETHTITFTNDCPDPDFQIPTLMQGNILLSNGTQPFTIDGPLVGAIAFLQTGRCGGFGGLPGNGCGIVEMTLVNPSTAGSNSSTDINIAFPFPFNVVLSFEYFNGCDGIGSNCTNEACPASQLPVSCDADNVNLAISFCALNSTLPDVEI
ncbi:glycopeptide [Mycena sanguinolenta]|nr:glycopeptide [Mycena sanguinolenta]